MKNYFYDVLPSEIQKYIIKIAEDDNRKNIIMNVYKPWCVRKHDWGHSIEEYRHIKTMDGKFWYMDLLIPKDVCGGVSCLKTSDNIYHLRPSSVYESCDIVDERCFLKICKYIPLQRSLNKRLWDEDYDVFIGNWWNDGYKSPVGVHLEMSNNTYDGGIIV